MKLSELPGKFRAFKKEQDEKEISRLENRLHEEREEQARKAKISELKGKLDKVRGVSKPKGMESPKNGSGFEDMLEGFHNLTFEEKPKKGQKKGSESFSGLKF